MDVTQLRGISRTATYFHNNSAATLEQVLDYYDAFFRSVVRQAVPSNLPASCRRTAPSSIAASSHRKRGQPCSPTCAKL